MFDIFMYKILEQMHDAWHNGILQEKAILIFKIESMLLSIFHHNWKHYKRLKMALPLDVASIVQFLVNPKKILF